MNEASSKNTVKNLLEDFDVFNSAVIHNISKNQSHDLIIKDITSENEILRRELLNAQQLLLKRDIEYRKLIENTQDTLSLILKKSENIRSQLINQNDFISLKYELEVANSSKRSLERDLTLQRAECTFIL